MVGADVGDSSRGAERASAMWLPGSASGTLTAHAHMVLLFVVLLYALFAYSWGRACFKSA